MLPVNGLIQVSPSSYIGSVLTLAWATNEKLSSIPWWRCDHCGAAIGKINQATNLPQETCYQCGAPIPERYQDKK